MINTSIINIAIKEAQKSNFKHRHGCVIFNGARVINAGFNEIRYCSKLNKKYRKWINSLHAEQKTILFAQSPIKRCSLLIIRINNKNQLVNSKPCKMCQSLIADVGITKVYYSDKSGLSQIQML